MAGAFKYGLKRSPEPPSLRFGAYLIPKKLPPIPATFGRANLFPKNGWLMLANDSYGDCTVAGAMHAIMAWNKLGERHVPRFTDLDAKDDYFTITGGQDTGADMVAVAKYWQRTGFRDAKVNRHRIAAYLAGDPTKPENIAAGCYLFGVVGWGVEVPSSAQDQFTEGVPWDPVPGDTIEGYHFVPQIDRLPNGNDLIVTWGAAQEVTPKWRQAYLQEVVYYISEEEMADGETPEGFNMQALEDDLAIVGD